MLHTDHLFEVGFLGHRIFTSRLGANKSVFEEVFDWHNLQRPGLHEFST